MKVDALLALDDLRRLPDDSRRAEDLGFDGIAVAETTHNPFIALALAAEHTRRVRLSTQIVLAFVRSPTTTAYAAFDLQRLSGGRLVLGLGSQTRWQITRRFGMPWSAPAERMHDYIRALHAVWQCWQDTGRRLQELAAQNRWSETPALVSDEMLRAFAAVGTYAQIGERILERFGSFAASVSLPLPAPEHREFLEPSLRLLQASRQPAPA